MFCRNCGKQIEEGLKFCPFCGADQAAPVAVPGAQPPPGGKKRGMKTATIVIIVVVAVLVLAGAAVGIYFGVKGSSDNSKPPVTTGTKPSSSTGSSKPVEPSTTKVEKIAYLNSKDIYVVNLDGTGSQRLTNRGDLIDFAVSPTGTMMAFVSQVGEQHIIFRMNADGTGVSQVTLPEKGIVDNPAFDPTGKYIYFTRVTPQDEANIQAGQPFSTGFERYNIAANSVDHIYSYGGMQEESISGLFPDPAGGNLYFNRYGSDFPSSIPYKLTLGASPTATVYMPMVTNSPGFTVIAYQLTGFSMDGAYLTYFKQALAADTSGPQISACYKLLSTGKETLVASYTQSQSSMGNIAGMQFSSVDANKYYYSKVSAVGPGSAWTFDFFKGTTNGTQSAAGLSVTVANAQNTDFTWHPLAVQK
jgi:zinc-ribbon domain/WD40-like Beta Propeller Repeat